MPSYSPEELIRRANEKWIAGKTSKSHKPARSHPYKNCGKFTGAQIKEIKRHIADSL
jgi:hypothetical protein